jgi:co-chaperonin GroES (HSP10)
MEINQGRILPTKILVKELKPETEEKKTATGIILPNLNKRNPQTSGEVVLVGEGTVNFPMPVKVGDTVYFTPLAGQKFELNEVEYLILDSTHVLFIVPK